MLVLDFSVTVDELSETSLQRLSFRIGNSVNMDVTGIFGIDRLRAVVLLGSRVLIEPLIKDRQTGTKDTSFITDERVVVHGLVL